MSRDDAAYGAWLLGQKLPHYRRLRAYERGEHPWLFASEKMRQLYEQLVRGYRLNICRQTVRQPARLLNIDAWDGDERAEQWWTDEGRRLQNRLHRETVRQGDAYQLVWPIDTMAGPLRTSRLRADEAIVVYSEAQTDTPEYGVKLWTVTPGGRKPSLTSTDQILRVNVYYPDRVERFVADRGTDGAGNFDLGQVEAGMFREWDDDGADSVIGYEGTLRDAGRDGTLPLVHFPAQPDDTPYGTSILEDVLPVQDELNHTARTMLPAVEAYGLPLRIFTAIVAEQDTYEIEVDGEKRTVTSDNMPDYHPLKDWFLTLPGENSKAIQLPAADLKQLLEVRRSAVQNATLVSGVPLNLLIEETGQMPSGVALRNVKSPLTDLVVDLQQDLTFPWMQVGRLLGWEAQPSWSSPVTMDQTEKWELASQMVDVGWPVRQALQDAVGLDADVVDQVMADAQEQDSSFASLLIAAEREGSDPARVLRP